MIKQEKKTTDVNDANVLHLAVGLWISADEVLFRWWIISTKTQKQQSLNYQQSQQSSEGITVQLNGQTPKYFLRMTHF